jgi:hypothetical protein
VRRRLWYQYGRIFVPVPWTLAWALGAVWFIEGCEKVIYRLADELCLARVAIQLRLGAPVRIIPWN